MADAKDERRHTARHHHDERRDEHYGCDVPRNLSAERGWPVIDHRARLLINKGARAINVSGVGFGILQLAIGSHAPWLMWITNTVGTIFLIVLATFLYTRGREVIDDRRRSRRRDA